MQSQKVKAINQSTTPRKQIDHIFMLQNQKEIEQQIGIFLIVSYPCFSYSAASKLLGSVHLILVSVSCGPFPNEQGSE
jgi:hypothetical protein